jgi:hypothetical protein
MRIKPKRGKNRDQLSINRWRGLMKETRLMKGNTRKKGRRKQIGREKEENPSGGRKFQSDIALSPPLIQFFSSPN